MNIYYNRLSKLKLRSRFLIIFLLISALMFAAEILIIYFNIIPKILSTGEGLDQVRLELISLGINKIVISLSVWAILLFISTSFLIYVLWNVDKYFSSIERKIGGGSE